MSIRIEETPNPNTKKFFLNTILTNGSGVYYVNREESSSSSPFVESLFTVAGVSAVFIGEDFVSITKSDFIEWENLKLDVTVNIMNYLSSGKEMFYTKQKEDVYDELDFSDPIIESIHSIIEERIRPAVMQDGGNVVFKSFKDGVVYLKLQGACSGCPGAASTLKDGIKNMLQFYVEEVVDVEAIE